MYFLPYILNIPVIHSGLQIPCVWLTPPLLLNTAKAQGDSDDECDSASQLDPDKEVELYEKAVEEAIAKGAEDEMVLEEGEPIANGCKFG
ncbi:hypothetical protein HGRIS_010749 [Hohenbuehelia grisea]|uniref:Uncharacterized protein n=1 Tax=Hohenbuehelia grisea TaxID=104357 RepID=A0ABR3IYH5_9AGAR